MLLTNWRLTAVTPWIYRNTEVDLKPTETTRRAEIGGHHYVVLAAAAAAFTTLAAVAILSDGFTKSTRSLTIARTAACILSVTALTGLVALLLAALVTRLLVGPLRP